MILRRPPSKQDEEWPKKCDFPRQQNEPLDENEQAPIPHLVPVLKIPSGHGANMNPTTPEIGNKQGLTPRMRC